MQTLEWWPDYARSPLCRVVDGVAVSGAAVGLDSGLAARLEQWGEAYAEEKLPIDGAGDSQWIEAGVGLLAEVRAALAGRYDVVVTEPWWSETAT